MTGNAAGFEGCDAASGLSWRFRPAPRADSAGILAVVFSQMRVPEGRFGLERLFANTRHPCLFLNCPDPVWYLGCETAIDREIARAIKAASPRRIVYYGASKGAHGALATALRRGDGEAFAFGPELALGQPGSQSARVLAPAMASAPDLAGPLAEAKVPVTLVFGIFDPVDAGGAAALGGRSLPEAVRVLRLASPHASHDHLYTLNIARKLIAGFDRDLAALCSERGLIAADTDAELAGFSGFASARATGRLTADAIAAARRDPHRARNPGHALEVARALAGIGAPVEAAQELALAQAAIDASPGARALPKRWLKTFWRERIAALRAGGEDRAADALAREAGQRFPTDAGWMQET
jgi:hypothetical protein